MTPVGPAHAGQVNRLNRIFTLRLGSNRAIVPVPKPVILGTHWEPRRGSDRVPDARPDCEGQ